MEGLTDLHRHLDGSLRAETLFELGEQQGIALPSGLNSICFYKGMGLMEAAGGGEVRGEEKRRSRPGVPFSPLAAHHKNFV